MASVSATRFVEQTSPKKADVDVRPEEAPRAAHKARVRASLEWALVEHASTLEKLSK